MNSEERILAKIDNLEKEIEELRKHMVDADSIMTEEDYEALLAYREAKKKNQLISHEKIKKKLGL